MTDSPLPPDATVARGDTPMPSSATGGRFAPGWIVAGRYRIVSLLGRGGMGEVYRADDTRLGHPVALKFLPSAAIHDPRTVERLIAEVRLGRQVSHPNVCRLYDITESDEGHFITMEYVDGEDLGSLLRRIGRLPPAKALELARDLSAGLAAAHDAGIVHRDLKPGNVMVDGRGRARITDFGLAVLEQGANPNERAGTPAYMSPEQLEGGPITLRSDLYALGLIFYEIFTGQRLYSGDTFNDVLSQRKSGKRPGISSVIREIDPAIERVVSRCLEDDPAARPSSAHAVIASLPGGDPLAAAVAAGETPSPAMVAAAGVVGDLRPIIAWMLLALALGTTFLVAALSSRTMFIRSVPLPKSADVLDARGQEVAERLGYTMPPVSTAHQFIWNEDYTRWMAEHDLSVDRWKAMARTRPGVVTFVFRSGTRELRAIRADYRITADDPPLLVPGMIEIALDPLGRLIEFRAVPPEQRSAGPRQAVDWNAPFREAAIDQARFHPVPAVWSMSVDSDEQRAWEGTLPEQPNIPIHIEAAADRGRLVGFSVKGPWDRPQPLQDPPQTPLARLLNWVNLLLEAGPVIPAVLLAIRNLRRERADRRAALRLAALCFVTTALAWMLRVDYTISPIQNWERVRMALHRASWVGLIAWFTYIALEPYVRRRWPHTLIAWSRLLNGRFRDPMVGRDVLAGVVGGVVIILLLYFHHLVSPWFGMAAPPPVSSATSFLSSPRHVLFFLLISTGEFAEGSLQLLFILVLARVLVRRQNVALGILWLLMSIAFVGAFNGSLAVRVPFAVASAAVLLLLMTRLGLLALMVGAVTWTWLRNIPPTLDLSSWYFPRLSLVLLAIAALAIYGFVVSLGGKPLFGAPLFDES